MAPFIPPYIRPSRATDPEHRSYRKQLEKEHPAYGWAPGLILGLLGIGLAINIEKDVKRCEERHEREDAERERRRKERKDRDRDGGGSRHRSTGGGGGGGGSSSSSGAGAGAGPRWREIDYRSSDRRRRSPDYYYPDIDQRRRRDSAAYYDDRYGRDERDWRSDRRARSTW